jgi:hypothetical protein
MKVLRAIACASLSLALAFSVTAQSSSTAAKPTYTVSTVKDFLAKLGPNRTIVLKKGDYKLWTAYEQSGNNFGWLEGDDGNELTIDNADNLTIRGETGARLITNSPGSYLIGFYGSSKLEIDNMTFVRQLDGDSTVGAGTLYVETAKSLSITKTTFQGPSGYPLEIWDCGDVSVKDTKIEGGSSGAISMGTTPTFLMKGGQISNGEGYPLIYAEECGSVTFDGTAFTDNSGGSFVEIYPAEGEETAFLFSKLTFTRNDFEYFAGNANLPETVGCTFVDGSFDETWPDTMVNLSTDESYGDYSSETYSYDDDEAGLSFEYPSWWEYQEGDKPGSVAIISDMDESLVYWAKATDIKTAFTASRDGEKLFAKALDTFKADLKSQGDMDIAFPNSVPLYQWEGAWQKEYRGSLKEANGVEANARLRLILLPKGVWAFLAVSSDDSMLEDGGQLETILSSLAQY